MIHTETILEHTTFRSVLQGMSRPGSIHCIAGDGRPDHLVTLLSSLLDNEVSVAAIGNGEAELLDRLVRATGCRISSAPEADFIIVQGGSSCGKLAGLLRGTAEYPESGATVLYLLDEVAAEGGAISLCGPGISESVSPLYRGLAEGELTLLGEINQDFPLGIDAIFLDRSGRMTCIPRSTRIGVK